MAGGYKPTKYKPEMCESLMDLMEEGKGYAQFCRQWRVGKTAFYDWLKIYPDFELAYEVGKTLSEAWWDDLGRENIFNKELNGAVWKFNMQNKFDWCSKVENDNRHSIDAAEWIKKLEEDAKNRGTP